MVQVRGGRLVATGTAPNPSVPTVPPSSREGAPWRTTLVAVVQAAPGAGLLRPHVRHLLGRRPPGDRRASRHPGHPRANRAPVLVRRPDAGARPPRCGPPDDRPRLRTGGLCELLSRLLRWRVGARWYAVALLTAPLLGAAVLLALSLHLAGLPPRILTTSDRGPSCCPARGRAPGGLRARSSAGRGSPPPGCGGATASWPRGWSWASCGGRGTTCVTLAWVAGAYVRRAASGALPDRERRPQSRGQLTAYRVLMVWVYDRTGSLLVAVLMHASLIASTLFILAPAALAGAVYCDLVPGLGRRVLARRWGRRRGQPRAALTTAASDAGGVKGGSA